MLALAVSTAFWHVMAIWIVLSLAQWVSFTTAIGERQRHAPAHLQARVGITGRAIAIGSMTAGATGASLLAHVVDLRTLYIGMGIATLLVAVVLGPEAAERAARSALPRAPRPATSELGDGRRTGADARLVGRFLGDARGARRERRHDHAAVGARRRRFSIVSENTCWRPASAPMWGTAPTRIRPASCSRATRAISPLIARLRSAMKSTRTP